MPKPPQFTPEQYDEAVRQLPWYWLKHHQIATPKGLAFEWETRPYLLHLYSDTARDITVMKGAQIGVSTFAIVKTLHLCEYNRVTVVFTEPTRDDTQRFSSTRVQPLIDMHPHLAQHWGGSTERRWRGPSHVLFKGTWGEKEAFTDDADMLIHDEVDKSKPDVLAIYPERLTASHFKITVRLSTPTVPRYGIDKHWRESDQHVLLNTCTACGKNDIDLARQYHEVIDRDRMCFRCPGCGAELNRGLYRWVPQQPSKTARGYHVSQIHFLMVPVESIVKKELDPDTTPSNFSNFTLGLPLASGTGAVDRDLILQRCFVPSPHEAPPPETHGDEASTYVAGIDQGIPLWVVIDKLVEGRRQRVAILNTPEWDEIPRILNRYGVRLACIDHAPERVQAEDLAGKLPGRVKYVERNVKLSGADILFDTRDPNLIQADRTKVMDRTAEQIIGGKLHVHRLNPEVDQWIKHWENLSRVAVEGDGGILDYLWVNTGPDHLADADSYSYIAMKVLEYQEANRSDVGFAFIDTHW